MDRDVFWTLGLYGASVVAYLACLVPLVLIRRDLKRAGVAPVRLVLSIVLQLLVADALLLVLASSFAVSEAARALATAFIALVVIWLTYRREHRRERGPS